jgi:hypothetical protein
MYLVPGGALGRRLQPGYAARSNEAFAYIYAHIAHAAPRRSYLYTGSRPSATPSDHGCQFENVTFYLEIADEAGNCPAGSAPLYRWSASPGQTLKERIG